VQALRRWGGLVFSCIWLVPAFAAGQIPGWPDTLLLTAVRQMAEPGSGVVRFRMTRDLEYSLSCTGITLLNREQEPNTTQVTLLQHLKYRSQFSNDRNLQITGSFVHDLGFQCIFDSISRFQADENTIDTRLEVGLGSHFSLSVFSRLTTCLFNSYNYSAGPAGSTVKTLGASFFTPMTWTFSAGFGWNAPGFATVTIGVSSARLTCILNRKIFDPPGISTFHGIPRDRDHLFEYGLSLHLLVDRDLSARIHWNCDALLFKNYRKPVDLVLDNLVGIRINKYLKAGIKTHISYEAEVIRKVQVENTISAGFCFTL
jgi:hypothetical protein